MSLTEKENQWGEKLRKLLVRRLTQMDQLNFLFVTVIGTGTTSKKV